MTNPGGKIRIFLLLFLSLLAGVPPASAESPPFKIYTTAEGLAHDSVNAIVRDSRGFLWFCTSEGLSRFDGRRFTNFTQNDGLPHRNVSAFLETRGGTYLVGTSLGLVVFDPKGRAYRWNVLESKLEKTSAEAPMFETITPAFDNRLKTSVQSLLEDDDGSIWVGTSLGLFRVRREAGGGWQFAEFVLEKDLNLVVHALLRDAQGGLVIASSGGIYRIFRGAVEIVEKPGAGTLMQDRDGRIWVGASGAPTGLRVFELAGEKLTRAAVYKTTDGLLADTFQTALKQLPDGRIYLGTASGLQEFRAGAKAGETKLRFLKDYFISAITEDSAGNLWVGTETKGAWQIASRGFVTYGEADGLSESEDIRAIYASRDGGIFLPTRESLVYLDKQGKFVRSMFAGVKTRSWGWHFLDFQAADGEWWVPVKDGLYRYPQAADFTDLARTPPKRIYTTRDGLHGDEVFVIFEDSRGDIWITNGEGGENNLSRWERRTDQIISYTSADGLPKFNGAISFAEDQHGAIWFGHYYGSLVRYRDGRFQTFTAKDGLPESRIDDLLTDAAGRLWIATTGRGLFRVDEPHAETPVFTSISTENGLSSNQIICLTEDRFNRIYAGTGRGINRIDRNGSIRVFTQADGLPGNFITRCAADKNGNLWFISQNILVRLTPEIERNAVTPPVFVDKVSVNGVPQKISVLGETEIRLPELSPNQTQIQIDFFALTFGVGENIRYQYRLDEQDWSTPTEQQTLNLNLTAGDHRFEVRAVRSDGVASEKTASVAFKILPPVWQRWWFIVLAALLVSGVIVLIYRYRIMNLRRINAALSEAKTAEENLRKSKEERLAELEKVRSRIATDLHDDIGASLTQIAVLSEVAQAQSKSSGAGESLTRITDVSNELVEAMSDIVWSINPAKDHLSDLVQRMRRFAADVFSARGIAFNFQTPGADFELKVGTNLRREVFLIFKEAVNNIAKHSGARHVAITLSVAGDDLSLEIADDGKGFAPENLYERSLSSAADYGGNGIASIRKRAVEMGGALKIQSASGAGTRVRLSLPLEKSMLY